MFNTITVLALLASNVAVQDSEKVVVTGARSASGEKIEPDKAVAEQWEPALPSGWTPPMPSGNPGGWVTTEDYPAQALRNELQGTVRFKLSVNAAGRVAGCTVTQSSGSEILDTKACSLISERAVFRPARDKRGRAVAGIYSNAVRWVIPKDMKRPAEDYLEFVLHVEADGSVSRCELVRADGAPPNFFEQFEKSCPGTGTFDQSYYDDNGKPVRRKVRRIMKTTIEPAS